MLVCIVNTRTHARICTRTHTHTHTARTGAGRAILTTIHQPSSRLYRQLDQVMLLVGGLLQRAEQSYPPDEALLLCAARTCVCVCVCGVSGPTGAPAPESDRAVQPPRLRAHAHRCNSAFA